MTWRCRTDTLHVEMLDTIEKLLVLQDRDRKVREVQGELAHLEPERQALRARLASAQQALEHAKNHVRQLETERKTLELEVETQKQLISKYANQQFQTRKNEEYRALAHEIEACKATIFKTEDREIELMEQGEAAQKAVAAATKSAADTKKLVDEQLALIATREANLKQELAELQANRDELAAAVNESDRGRYERLVRSKGENVIVGVHHGVCGGCHMRLQPQLLVLCQAGKEMVTCSNCGRILYYTRDMDLAVAD